MNTLAVFLPMVLLLSAHVATLEGRPASEKADSRNVSCIDCVKTESSGSSVFSSSYANASITIGGPASSNSSEDQTTSTSSKDNSSPELGANLPPSPSPTPSPTPVNGIQHGGKNLTERIRKEILRADIIRLAKLIVENDAIEELALGFTFPEELRDRYLVETPYRFFDPDVIALKGMAKAILMSKQAPKLTEIFIGAVYGLDFDTNLCPEKTPSHKVQRKYYYWKSKSQVTTTYSSSSSHSSKFVTVTYTSSDGKSTTFTHTCFSTSHTTTTTSRTHTSNYEHSFKKHEHSKIGGHQTESRIPECYTPKEIKQIRGGLLDDFNNLELMNEILYSDPRTESRRLRRRLLVIGTPVNSWLCADCWKPRFCNRNAWWCPAQ